MITEGKIIRDFKIVKKIGEGGMGTVWSAEDLMLERPVALKMLNPLLTQDANFIERFRQEAKIQAGLIHPNIITLHSFFMDEGNYYMVMEYAEGITLKELIKQKGKLDENTAKQLMLQILEGVGYAHQLGIVHRDLKPSNIMVNKNGNVKIMDFGIAKVLGDRGMTKTGTKMGTLYYMSPEQIKAEKDIDQRTDIYSLGIIFYEMLTGKVPFNTETESDFVVMSEIVAGNIAKRIRNLNTLSLNAKNIITKMTKNNKGDRYITCYTCSEEIKGNITENNKINNTINNNIEILEPEAKEINKPELIKSNIIEPEMIYVEGGSFVRYSYKFLIFGKKEHQVTVSSFYIGKFQVTQKEWERVMGNNPSYFKGDSLPVENVTWNDVQKFINKLNQLTGKNYRLPTEAEWEYAARGGNKSKGYEYAGSNNINEVAWYWDNSSGKTHPVGTKKPNELGIYDMSGNVLEWCQDWFDENYYKKSPSYNPKGPSSGEYHVMRGGSCIADDWCCSCSFRIYSKPDEKTKFIGFRLAHD